MLSISYFRMIGVFLLLSILPSIVSSPQECQNALVPSYAAVFAPEYERSHAAFLELPGFTRSVYKSDHALISPESRVWLPNPTWPGCKTAHLISPATGSHFTMFLVQMMEGGRTSHHISHRSKDTVAFQRFVLVLSGTVHVYQQGIDKIKVETNGFAYFPEGSTYQLESEGTASLLVYERRVDNLKLPEQEMIFGEVENMPLLDTGAEMFALRKLLPETENFLFNVHIMDFQPGEHLLVHEVHYNQHGLLMLQGQGIYRLADSWYPVQAGDAIYMAPFCPQWYGALGQTRSRYVIYKDVSLDPLMV